MTTPVPERYMDKIVYEGDCWLWRGGPGYGTKGYGMIGRQYVHRLAYERLVGPIPAGHIIHHRCENTRCCNPEHLEPMTQSDHMRLHKTATHCKRGHLLAETAVNNGGGKRACGACRQIRKAAA